jgi:hypothetical protein
VPQYPPSAFEAAVAGFLQGYGTVSGIRQQRQEAADRSRAANRADQMARIQINEAGYDEVPMPKIEAPPGQNILQKVGRFLSGPEQPSSIVVKTHPSVRETEISGAQQFETGRDQARFGNERAVTELQGALQARLDANRQAHEDARNAADNRTRLAVAGMEKGSRSDVLKASLRDAFFDQAVAAANGDPVQAQRNVGTYQMSDAVKFKASRADYYAAAARYSDRKAELTREGIAARGGSFMPPPGVKPPAGRPASNPTKQAVQPSQGTLVPLGASDKQAAQKDPGFAAHLQSLGYVKGRDF